jgi:hypothetical protein
MKISRDWATPLTIGVFALMAVTGLLMFFHLDTQLQKTVHEWAGWLMLAAVVTHVFVNWMAFKRYLATRGKGLAIVSAFVLTVLVSFAIRPSGSEAPSVPALAIAALRDAPLRAVAGVYGKTPEQARSELAAAGIALANEDASLASAIGGSREKLGQALAVLARKPGR